MKLPKHIKVKVEKILKMRIEANKLELELYNWLDNKNIDTINDKWKDGICVRLSYAEFSNADELEEEINKFINGENIGYG